jgi:methylated-DNA-[protein]-cysteine S-methyltransferase
MTSVPVAENHDSYPVGFWGPTRAIPLAADTLDTPIGRLLILCDAEALCVVDYDDFGDRMHRLLRRRYGSYDIVRTANPLGMTTLLERYFAGELGAIDTARVETGGTPYQRRVWNSLRTIPHGQTRTYGQLAAYLGGTHARAVGNANSLNPIGIVVPCHRVIGANAKLTGYAGGLERKRWLLDHEAQHGAISLFPAT